MTKKALVVVLGELARSPRMQYHCISLANNNYQVTVIANDGEKACEGLESNRNITKSLMPEAPDFKRYLPQLFALMMKLLWQGFLLLYHLSIISSVDIILVQNPPSIPTLPILCFYCKVFGTKLIIDWHNYGYSILGLKLGPSHPLVRIFKWAEMTFGRWADAGFCVSEAMLKDLVKTFKITYPMYVLYDKPPKHFKPLSLREKHNFYRKIGKQIPEFRSLWEDCSDKEPHLASRHDTRFTMAFPNEKNAVVLQPKRPAIIMSSTSWTEDEDFGLLLGALKRYDLLLSDQLRRQDFDASDTTNRLPRLVCVITGKGPLKEYYEAKIKELRFSYLEVTLPWLSALDYAKMVASCDIGVSLHSSSSGLDLPMKIVDMFGCGIPVLAYKFPAINELVIEDFYGLTFDGSDDLFTKLVLLLQDFYTEDTCSRYEVEKSSLGRYKKNIKRRFLLSRWEDNWNREAKPVFDRLQLASKITSNRYH